MAARTKAPVSKTFYVNSVTGRPFPVLSAGDVVSSKGVTLSAVQELNRSFTPDELIQMGRWLHSLAKEAQDLVKEGLVTADQSYHVGLGKVISL